MQDKGAAYPVDGPDQRGVLRAGRSVVGGRVSKAGWDTATGRWQRGQWTCRSVVGGRVSKAVWDTGPNGRQDSKIHEDFCKNNIPHFENKQIAVWK